VCSTSSQFTTLTGRGETSSPSTLLDKKEEGNSPLVGNIPLRGMESASRVASDITNAIDAQRIEMDEKERTLGMMKKAMVSVSN